MESPIPYRWKFAFTICVSFFFGLVGCGAMREVGSPIYLLYPVLVTGMIAFGYAFCAPAALQRVMLATFGIGFLVGIANFYGVRLLPSTHGTNFIVAADFILGVWLEDRWSVAAQNRDARSVFSFLRA